MRQVIRVNMKRAQKQKDYSIVAYIIGYGIAIAFLTLPYLCSASTMESSIDEKPNKSGYNYKKNKRKFKRFHRRVRMFNINGCKNSCPTC